MTKTELIPFLSLNGQANEAIAFYEKALGAKVVFKKTLLEVQQMGAPIKLTPEIENQVSHSVLVLPTGGELMINDAPVDGAPFVSGNNQSICLQSTDKDQITTLYQGLVTNSDQVDIITPLTSNVFSPAYGIVKDPFGIVWQLTTSIHNDF
ncbi:VOC family protein [Secundilactobacillus collinoides]|nr:VOC family protein [Secundilactobacillus collinoides]KZL41090.1 hypothetical protein TY91_07525 [Secundilactobacillus collinoides]